MAITKQQLARAQALFDAALDLDPAARTAYIERECAADVELRDYVLQLLAAHEHGDQTIQRAVRTAAQEWGTPESPGRRLGAYTLLEVLGSGGMGTVWLAERADDAYQARVAVKLIRGGFVHADLERRMRVERQILADLAHPGIARLLDGGETDDGTPFIVMEYIDGKPITTYAAEHGLAVRARIELFLRVCAAVQHAHASLVVHRDIKPANILVDADGVPKLVDFGIAKPLAADADATTILDRRLTPSYASPEQVRGERITTATDVFSLGVLLYELLAGEQPFASADTSPVEVQRRVLEDEPAPPSAIARKRTGEHVARELDTIVARAMRKDAEQRYASVEQLADDLRRHLAGLPIHAVPPSTLYRARRFVERNRIGVGAAALALLLATGAVGFHTVRVTRERDSARAERETSDRVAQFMVDLFQYVDPEAARGKTITAAELLHAAAEQLDTALHDQPRVRARLLLNIADVYSNIGMGDAAVPLIEDVIETKRSLAGPPDLELLRAIYLQARRGGREDWEHVLALADSIGAPARQYALLARGAVARSIAEAGELDRALAIMKEVMAGATDLQGEYADGISEAEWQMGSLLNARNRFSEAEPYLASSLARRRQQLGADEPRTLRAMDDLSITLNALGRYRESEALTQERLGHVRRITPDNSTSIARSLMSLSTDARNLGRPVQAESLAVEALASVRLRAPNSASAGFIVRMLGLAQAEQGRLAAAEATLREALRIAEATLGADHLVTGRVVVDLAAVRRDRGDLQEALQLVQRALGTAREQTGVESMQYAAHEEALARILLRQGARAEADSASESALRKLRALLPAGHPIVATALETRAEVALARGNAQAAAAAAREAIGIREAAMPDNRALLGEGRSVLGAALLELGNTREAAELLTRAHRDLLDVRGPDHPTTLLSARRLGAARAAARG